MIEKLVGYDFYFMTFISTTTMMQCNFWQRILWRRDEMPTQPNLQCFKNFAELEI